MLIAIAGSAGLAKGMQTPGIIAKATMTSVRGKAAFTAIDAGCHRLARQVGDKPLPIPSFDLRGLVPAFVGSDATGAARSPYYATITEIVTAFGTSEPRRALLRNLIAYRRILSGEGYSSGFQYLDGSFVEQIEGRTGSPPNDIDVFSLLSAPTRYVTDSSLWIRVGKPFWDAEVANTRANKARFSLDTYALLTNELDNYGIINSVIYWYILFSHQRLTFEWKGFVAITMDTSQDDTALQMLGGT